jgi:hypothetical protein
MRVGPARGQRVRSSTIASIWSRNHGSIRQARGRSSTDAAREQLADLEDAIGRRRRRRGQQLVVASASSCASAGSQLSPSGPARASAVPSAGSRERAADRHRLADRLHLRAEHAARAGNFSNAHRGILRDDVVDRRLEARGVARVMSFGISSRVYPTASLRGDLGDREAGGLRCERRLRETRGFISITTMAAGDRVDGETGTFEPARLHADAADARRSRVAHCWYSTSVSVCAERR